MHTIQDSAINGAVLPRSLKSLASRLDQLAALPSWRGKRFAFDMLRLIALVGGMFCASLGLAAGPRPNILVIVADDLGYGELGCQGNREIPTPHIDSIARNGIRFTQGYVTASLCSPSRAALLTGRYQQRFGHELNAIGRENLQPHIGLPLTEQTLADRLKAAGYATAMAGKWHLGGTEKFHPQRRGFDEYFGFLHEGHTYIAPDAPGAHSFLRTNATGSAQATRLTNGTITWSMHTRGNEPFYDDANPVLRGTREVQEAAYLTEAFTREAVSFIERQRARPWFLYLPYNAVHSPMQATARDLARFGNIADEHRRIFAAMLASLDNGVGVVLARLRELHLTGQTLVFFISDNGGPTQELTSSNAPLSGGKGTLLEGGIRVPFLAQWEGTWPRGVTSDLVVSSLDIVPTVLAAAGVRSDPTARFDGVDLAPFLTGQVSGAAHPALFWRLGGQAALRSGGWKLVRSRGATGWQLFNLTNDPSEQRDLAPAEPDRLKQLAAVYEKWNAELSPPLWGNSPAGGKKKGNLFKPPLKP